TVLLAEMSAARTLEIGSGIPRHRMGHSRSLRSAPGGVTIGPPGTLAVRLDHCLAIIATPRHALTPLSAVRSSRSGRERVPGHLRPVRWRVPGRKLPGEYLNFRLIHDP